MNAGRVQEFHEARGRGTIITETGVEYPFHCIDLADGTRTIEPGTEVVFGVARRFGRFEATSVLRR